MAVDVVPSSQEWPRQFERVAGQLRVLPTGLPATVEHVGSTVVALQEMLAATDLTDAERQLILELDSGN